MVINWFLRDCKSLVRVEACPEGPERLGLCNLSESTWKATREDGEESSVEPKRLKPLLPGQVIDFGTAKGGVSA